MRKSKITLLLFSSVFLFPLFLCAQGQNNLEELKERYFKENKFNEFVDELNSLAKKNKALSPAIDYYIGLARYSQLKHLEEAQDWDEYFNKGNDYRQEMTGSLERAVDTLAQQDALSLDARLILWKFHRDQQDAFHEGALTDLVNAAPGYVNSASDLNPVKNIAAELFSSGEKSKARELYKLYLDKILSSGITDEELNVIASGFLREGNLELAESVYDVYIERLIKAAKIEKTLPLLIEIAGKFSSKDEGVVDMPYAEKVFKRIEEIGGKGAFSEELMYMRALNLEKMKDYAAAKDYYAQLAQDYPTGQHKDEADFKLGIIYTYIMNDVATGKSYFGRLSQKSSPQGLSSLYHLGLLSQWEGDSLKAMENYNKLIEQAKDPLAETAAQASERLKEIEEARPIEYNLKSFLDLSLKEESQLPEGAPRTELKSSPLRVKRDEKVNISSTLPTMESGCTQVEIQYLWSGDLGASQPQTNSPSFTTSYNRTGTKEINLVVISPSGVVDRNIELLEVY